MSDGGITNNPPVLRPLPSPVPPAAPRDEADKPTQMPRGDCIRQLWEIKFARENAYRARFTHEAYWTQVRVRLAEQKFKDMGCPGQPTDDPINMSAKSDATQAFSILSEEPRVAWWVEVGSVMAMGQAMSNMASRLWWVKDALAASAGSFFVTATYFDRLQQLDLDRGPIL